MSKRFKGEHSTVVVAVAPDKHAPNLVQAAAGLCKRTGMRLRLVQVAEYWAGRSWPREITLEGPLAEAITAVEDESLRAAQGHLRKLAEAVPREVTVETNAIAGFPAEGIIADAVANKAAVIFTGAAKGSHRFVPKGLSTALSLMSDSPVPVIVMQEGCTTDFTKRDFGVLLADDLSDHSEAAVMTGYDFTSALGGASLHHLHVNSLTEENLKISLEAASAASHAGSLRGLTGKEVYAMAIKALEQKMKGRAPGRRLLLEASGGKYESEVVTGVVADELQQVAARTGVEMFIFGRHRTFRRKPFLIGQLPFYAMLTPNRPIMIVPSEI